MSNPRRTAVSYARFSSQNQAKGDSETRQEREYRAFCERHNLAPGKEVYIDRGLSGYHDMHRTKGALGVLMLHAKSGRFDRGTVIVVEAWDRLGRLRPDDQIQLIRELLKTGVSIGVSSLNNVFSEDDFGDASKWVTLAVFIQLAYSESKQKSDRLKSAWAGRRTRARGGEKMLGHLPAWVERVRGELRLIPERAAAVRRIFELAAEGNGLTRIIQALIAEEIAPFGERRVSEHATRSFFAGKWTKGYVAKILGDRRAVGEHQLHKDRKPDGPPIAGYYPPAVTEDAFNAARAARTQKGPKRIRQRKYVNCFKGLLVHARDNEPMYTYSRVKGGKARLYLRNQESVGACVTIPYDMFERCILAKLREVRPEDVIPADERPANSAGVIRAKLGAVRADLAAIKADLAASYSKALSDVLRQKEAEELELVNELQDELARTAKPLSKAWDDAQGVLGALDGAEDKDAMRIRIRAALAAVVESGVLMVAGTKFDRVIVVQFDFVGGGRRTWIIKYLPANGARPNPPAPECESAPWRGEQLDLRQPAHLARLERELLAAMK